MGIIIILTGALKSVVFFLSEKYELLIQFIFQRKINHLTALIENLFDIYAWW